MRKPDKSSLRKAVMKMEDAIGKEDILNPQSKFVLDGGALLHRVRWAKDALFGELANTYVSYVRRHYGLASIAFDGYSDLSTKDSEHARRAQKKCHDIEGKEINQCTTTQDRFLSNENNKSQFIALISQYLRNDHQNVINCNGDADTTIVKTAIDQATTSVNSVVVVADDTDIAITPRITGKIAWLILYFIRSDYKEMEYEIINTRTNNNKRTSSFHSCVVWV